MLIHVIADCSENLNEYASDIRSYKLVIYCRKFIHVIDTKCVKNPVKTRELGGLVQNNVPRFVAHGVCTVYCSLKQLSYEHQWLGIGFT